MLSLAGRLWTSWPHPRGVLCPSGAWPGLLRGSSTPEILWCHVSHRPDPPVITNLPKVQSVLGKGYGWAKIRSRHGSNGLAIGLIGKFCSVVGMAFRGPSRALATAGVARTHSRVTEGARAHLSSSYAWGEHLDAISDSFTSFRFVHSLGSALVRCTHDGHR